MRADKDRYSEVLCENKLGCKVFEARCPLINRATKYDITYQYNKIFNLKLAAKKLDGLMIKPGETFSFWKAVRYADKQIPYKDGLIVVDGKLTTAPGGGLCQMSNLLFWVLLHSPLTITERHAHRIKDFPSLQKDAPNGTDATIREGWLDLKVKNETSANFQIGIDFCGENIVGTLYSDRMLPHKYSVSGRNECYFRKDGKIFEQIEIFRTETDLNTGEKSAEVPLYVNLCEVGYALPKHITIQNNEGDTHD